MDILKNDAFLFDNDDDFFDYSIEWPNLSSPDSKIFDNFNEFDDHAAIGKSILCEDNPESCNIKIDGYFDGIEKHQNNSVSDDSLQTNNFSINHNNNRNDIINNQNFHSTKLDLLNKVEKMFDNELSKIKNQQIIMTNNQKSIILDNQINTEVEVPTEKIENQIKNRIIQSHENSFCQMVISSLSSINWSYDAVVPKYCSEFQLHSDDFENESKIELNIKKSFSNDDTIDENPSKVIQAKTPSYKSKRKGKKCENKLKTLINDANPKFPNYFIYIPDIYNISIYEALKRITGTYFTQKELSIIRKTIFSSILPPFSRDEQRDKKKNIEGLEGKRFLLIPLLLRKDVQFDLQNFVFKRRPDTELGKMLLYLSRNALYSCSK